MESILHKFYIDIGAPSYISGIILPMIIAWLIRYTKLKLKQLNNLREEMIKLSKDIESIEKQLKIAILFLNKNIK